MDWRLPENRREDAWHWDGDRADEAVKCPLPR